MGAAYGGQSRELPPNVKKKPLGRRSSAEGAALSVASSSSVVGRRGSVVKPSQEQPEAANADGRVPFRELFKPWRVFREGLQPGAQRLAVRLGPVVGKVTDTTAVILLEVEAPGGDVTLNVARALPSRPSASARDAALEQPIWTFDPSLSALPLESVDFTAVGSVSVCQIMEPCRPYSFALEGLEPETAYFVFVGGVREEDLERRVARFRTLPERVDSLRLLVVSGHQPLPKDFGHADPWSRVLQRACEGPEVQVVLHLGGTVDTAPAAEEAAQQMKEHGSFRVGIRRELERRAREVLRGAFAAAWGQHEGLRRVLGEVGSHLPAFSPIVNLDPLLRRPAVGEALEEQRALLRVVVDVSREYQRALWQPGRTGGSCSVRIDAGGASPQTGSFHYREFWQEAGPVSDMAAEEWHFHRYGQICVAVLDTKGSLLSSCGLSGKVMDVDALEAVPLLSMRQRDALNRVLKDRMIQVLVVACDAPFFLEPISAASHPKRNSFSSLPAVTGTHLCRTRSKQSMPSMQSLPSFADSAEESGGNSTAWRAHLDELAELLEMLFEWKLAQYPDREVVLISAGPGFGTTGDVWDQKLGLSIPTVVTGPVLGQPSSSAPWALNGSLGADRFSWAYRPPEEQGNFCTLDVDLGTSDSGLGLLSIDVDLVSMPPPPDAPQPGGRAAAAPTEAFLPRTASRF